MYLPSDCLKNTLDNVHHHWGEVDNLNDLKKYLSEVACRKTVKARAAMAQLTPTSKAKIALDGYGGLKKLADEVAPHVSKWYRENWGSCANIVTTDFFLSTDIINVAIEVDRNPPVRSKLILKN